MASEHVETRPGFSESWIEECHGRGEPGLSYIVSGVPVKIFSPGSRSTSVYAIFPPEYSLPAPQVQALAGAIADVMSTAPPDLEMRSLTAVRAFIKSKAKDSIFSRLNSKKPNAEHARIDARTCEVLSDFVCKYTAGYGILETLLQDPMVQDIYVDSPSAKTPVHVVLRSDASASVRQKCRTNIFLGSRDLRAVVSRVKFESGLPFSEAHPVLEADISRLGLRMTVVGPPVSDKGVSLAIRKHSRTAWALHMLVANGTLSPLLSSFLWACVVGRRTALVAGSRGAGKTTLLSAMMLEFPLSQRIILIEDTPEIPIKRFQALGFDIQGLRFSNDSGEGLSTAEGALRVSLRMGESAIVVGEVRGSEASVLYESMRAGSAGSSVLGTIHGNSPRGVLDRAVEDLGISERAFSSTDIIVSIGLIRSPDGSRFCRRVTQVAEVRLRAGAVDLVSLFDTEPGCLCAKPTQAFDQECGTITGVAEVLGRPPGVVMDIIRARAHADQLMSEQIPGACDHDFCRPWDELRVDSNERLSGLLLCEEGPEAGLSRWMEWFEKQLSGEEAARNI